MELTASDRYHLPFNDLVTYPVATRTHAREIDLDSDGAEVFCRAWKGYSQASSHAPHDSKHFPVHATALEEALRIIVSHLDKTVYSASHEGVSANLAEPEKA